jgi:hypothetical protein
MSFRSRKRANAARETRTDLTSVSLSLRELHLFELEPEVRDWLDNLTDGEFKRVDQVCGMLAEKGTGLGGPWPRSRSCA